MTIDLSKMKIYELVRFAEEQRRRNKMRRHEASRANTLELLKTMKERGAPESSADKD